ncbi:MAG: aminotransferase class V-fold PLP-dependent enzyme [Dysgonamonadaceae bacterium]|jgi:O-acetylhomoserine (thiol)-lyase|nr:aminotransferase class V-fold PLP-dependent enzyme [Dysgonamonadaceae bacterium]
MKKEKKDISTLILNQRFLREDTHGSISMPVYSGAAFEFASAEEMESAFLGKSGRHTYSRISNPTVEAFESRIRQVSGAAHVLAVSSGMAAISNVFLTIAYAGSNIVTSTHLFGNTFSLFLVTLKAFGVEVRFCNLLDSNDVAKNIDDKTCAVFTEIITNPHMEVADLKALAETAHSRNVPLVVDSTIVPWPAFEARKFGVDLEVVSSTKYLSGGATSIGGLVIDYQTFDWSHSPRLNTLAQTAGEKAFTVKIRTEVSRNLGAYMSPQTASLQSLGLETLSLRFQRASQSCKELAAYLQTLPGIVSVQYTGLPDNPFYKISCEQFGEYPGAMLTFNLSSQAACYAFINRLKVIRRATNLFDNKSLIIHPLSTIYGPLSDEYKKMVDVPANMLRLSVGLENVEDLKADLLQAFLPKP